jgi:hypothetical protein
MMRTPVYQESLAVRFSIQETLLPALSESVREFAELQIVSRTLCELRGELETLSGVLSPEFHHRCRHSQYTVLGCDQSGRFVQKLRIE